MVKNTEKSLADFIEMSETLKASTEGAFVGISEMIQSVGSVMASFETMAAPFWKVFSGISASLSSVTFDMEAWGNVVGESLAGVIQKAVGFGVSFLQCLNFAAGLGLLAVGLGILYQMFGDQIDQILLMITERGPQIITNLCNGIIMALPGLIEQGAILMNGLMLALTANLPAIITGGMGILEALIMGISLQLPMLIPTAVGLIMTLVTSLMGSLPMLVTSGLTLITGLVQGLLNSIPVIIAAIPKLIQSLVTGIISSLPQIISTGVELVVSLIMGLIQAIPQIVRAIPQIITSIKNTFIDVDWGAVGKDIIKGIGQGVKNAAGGLAKAAADAAKDALNWVKEKLGIQSPSRVFRDEVGKMMAYGMGIGFKENIPVRQMDEGVEAAVRRLKQGAVTAATVTSGVLSGNADRIACSIGMSTFDFDEYERRQRRLNRERDDRPVFLNSRQVNRALKKGEPVTV